MKKLFTLLTLVLCVCTGAWADVTDLAFTDTKTITSGGEIWWTTADNVASANTAGWCSNMTTYGSNNKYGNITPSLSGDVTDTGGSPNHKIDGVLVKGGNTPIMEAGNDGKGKKALAFKVKNTTTITAYGATTSSSGAAGLQWSVYKASDKSAIATNAKGKAAAPNNTATITITGLSASETYIVCIEGGYKGTSGEDVGSETQDVVVYAVKFAAPQAGKPTINTQPVSATYESGDAIAALTVSASASSGDLSYHWYKCDNADKENPVEKGNSASYTPTEGGYYYCKVTDSNGDTESNVATISVVNAFTPEISFADPTVSITYLGSGAVYYTIDGTEPSSSNGTVYDGSFNLTNSCTVRAIAKKGENYSELVKYDCYINQSGAEGFLISTGSHSGTNSGSIWTSNDGNFTLSKPNGDFQWSNNIFPGMHGHKMDNGTVYTLQPKEDIKITSVKIVGRTWLNGSAATVTVSGGTPESATWLAGETGNVSYIQTKEFTVDANYGEAVTVSPTGNQFGCFLEVYGIKRNGPAAPEAVSSEPITWDFTDREAQSFDSDKSYSFTATDGTTEMRYSAGSSDAIVAKSDNADGYLKENGATSNSNDAKDIDNETVVGKTRLIRLYVTGKGKLTINCGSKIGVYTVKDGSTSGTTLINSYTANTQSEEITVSNSLWIETTTKGYINTIVWTPSSEDITLTTTANMAGWRAFYDDSKSYTVDENTKIYTVTAKDETKATLTKVTGRIPAQTPVLLKTSDANHTMTLTAATTGDAINTTGNLLQATNGSAVSNVYRLGYGAESVGFYQYSATNPANGIVYLPANAGGANAKALTFSFSDVTGISNAAAAEAANAGTGKMYNLSGQIVGEGYKGIVIVNGKKVNK